MNKIKNILPNKKEICVININITTVLPAKSDGDAMFCLRSCQGLIIDRSLVY